jgi:hypothetical protein
MFVDAARPAHVAYYDTVDTAQAFMWLPGQRAEFWIVPGILDDLPRFPLPEMEVRVHGWIYHRGRPELVSDATAAVSFWSRVRTVRLERARAIELGLVGRDEPEWDGA